MKVAVVIVCVLIAAIYAHPSEKKTNNEEVRAEADKLNGGAESQSGLVRDKRSYGN